MNKAGMIWIVDDDDIYSFTVRKVIEKTKIAEQTRFFPNGAFALSYLKDYFLEVDKMPDIILLDINMPILDGWQFLDEFTKLAPTIHKNISINMVSSSIDEDDFRKAHSYRYVSDFIIKPITPDKLLKIMEKWKVSS